MTGKKENDARIQPRPEKGGRLDERAPAPGIKGIDWPKAPPPPAPPPTKPDGGAPAGGRPGK